jgi:DNA ligase-1
MEYKITILTGTNKMKEYTHIINKGKNIGKKNETTYYEQARIFMNTKINKKRDEGYNETVKDTENPLPMLSLEFSKRKHDIQFPCFIQPKLDGVRAIYSLETGFYSRTGKTYSTLEHITKELNQILEKTKGLFIDGELYSTELTFQELTGLVRKEKLTTQDVKNLKKIHYAVFDIISDKDFEDRIRFIKENLSGLKHTKIVKTKLVYTEEEIHDHHRIFVDEGYEGIMIRNTEGSYEVNTSSKNLQKLKFTMVEEFEIIGAKQGTGTEEGCVIWIVKVSDNQETDVRPIGSFEIRKELYKHYKDYIGKLLSVKFQEYTNDGIPRFPVGLVIRDYE